jgi:hypothetical protein
MIVGVASTHTNATALSVRVKQYNTIRHSL